MNTPTKLGAYAVGLAAVFGGATAIGAATGPVGSTEPAHHVSDTASHGGSTKDQEMEDNTTSMVGASGPGGLEVSKDGYTLDVAEELPAGSATPVSFRIVGPDNRAVTAYKTAHGEELHLIAVRRDLAGYQHVHPVLGDDGTWSVPLDLTPGAWRLFADFDPSGADTALVLGADVSVGGDYQPRPLQAPSRTVQVDDFTVTLDGDITPGQESELRLTVARAGQPVSDLQPYLGAFGHLVALRVGDLAYLHVHPAGEPGDGTTKAGPDVTFYATAPSPGAYGLFFDFKHGDVVRTAEFTVHGGDDADTSVPPVSADAAGHGADGHGH